MDQALAIFSTDHGLTESLLSIWEQNRRTRLRRLEEYKPLLAGGQVERGREWFITAMCVGCHRVGERGGDIGPDLTRIGAVRSGDDLLESILFPSSSFAQGYEPYTLTLRNGEEFSGTLIAQGPDGISLRDGAGMLRRVATPDVVSFNRQELSTMPEGLEQLLSPEQFRDLLAYLQNLK